MTDEIAPVNLFQIAARLTFERSQMSLKPKRLN
jgi:hypothetical protein